MTRVNVFPIGKQKKKKKCLGFFSLMMHLGNIYFKFAEICYLKRKSFTKQNVNCVITDIQC